MSISGAFSAIPVPQGGATPARDPVAAETRAQTGSADLSVEQVVTPTPTVQGSGFAPRNGSAQIFAQTVVDPATLIALQQQRSGADSDFGLTPQNNNQSQGGQLSGVAVAPVGPEASTSVIGAFADQAARDAGPQQNGIAGRGVNISV